MPTKNSSSSSKGVGPSNTNIGPTEESQPKKKQPSAALAWPFTFNNYPEDWKETLVPKFQNPRVHGGIIGVEVGEEGTNHLQGFIVFHPPKTRPFTIFGDTIPKQIHWERKYPKATIEHNIAYCSKDGDFTAWGCCIPKRIPISILIEEEDIMPYEEMFPWGQELESMVQGRLPDKKDRRIFWYWSEAGQMKKTETARRLVYHHDALVIQGGRKHILANAYKNPCPIYVLLIPRADEGFVSYASIELLKDSLYMSNFGCEATGSVNRKKPWVIIFANFAPEYGKISTDRWVIQCVDL